MRKRALLRWDAELRSPSAGGVFEGELSGAEDRPQIGTHCVSLTASRSLARCRLKPKKNGPSELSQGVTPGLTRRAACSIT